VRIPAGKRSGRHLTMTAAITQLLAYPAFACRITDWRVRLAAGHRIGH